MQRALGRSSPTSGGMLCKELSQMRRMGAGPEASMSKITVTIDAEGQGSFKFDWEGDVQELQDNIDEIERLARRNELDLDEFARAALMQFPSTGPITGPGGETQRIVILCAILRLAEDHAGKLPSPVLDCLADQDIIAHVTIRGTELSVVIAGRSEILH
jgi:hypothetical protein